MCQCAEVFRFQTSLWRVIKRGSSVRWMCNHISPSFSFFLPFPYSISVSLCLGLLLGFCHSCSLSRLSSKLGELASVYRPARDAPASVCVKLAEGYTCVCKFKLQMYSASLCMCHSLNLLQYKSALSLSRAALWLIHTHTHRLCWQHLLCAPWISLLSVNWSFKSVQLLCNGKRHYSNTYWLLVIDLMACKFSFFGGQEYVWHNAAGTGRKPF